MNKISLKLILGGLVSILILIMFFIQNYLFYQIPHEAIHSSVQQLQILDFQMVEQTLTAKAKNFYNYDFMRNIQIEEDISYKKLQGFLPIFRGQNFVNYLANYEDKNRQNHLRLKRFSTANIQLKIALSNIPTLSKQINLELPNEIKKIGRVKTLSDLISDINTYVISGNEQLIPQIELTIAKLKSEDFTSEQIKTLQLRTIQSVTTILKNTQLIEDIIPMITSQNSSKELKLFITGYNEFYEQKKKIVTIYRWLFFPLVALLLLYLGILIFQLEKTKEEQQARMSKELTTAQAIQQTLFSADNYESDYIQMAGNYIPASECGGDWWYYSKVSGKYLLWIGDATGHGVSAALITSAARSAASMIEQFESHIDSPGKILTHLNRAIHDSSKGSMMMTFFMAIYDPQSRVLKYSNAAHEPPVIFNFMDKELSYKKFKFITDTSGPRLGEHQEYHYGESSIKMDINDTILLFSDGALNIQCQDGSFLTERKFFNLVGKSISTSNNVKSSIDTLSLSLKKYYENDILMDDITFLMMRTF